MMTAIATLPSHLACMIEALCGIMVREGRRLQMPQPLIELAWGRMARLANRFIDVVERFCAGTLPPPGLPAASPTRGRAPSPRRAARLCWHPRHFAWLLRIMKPQVRDCALALAHFLSFAEMEDLVRDAPQAGRAL